MFCILLEIPPLHELYFFRIILINELGGGFSLIFTSGEIYSISYEKLAYVISSRYD